MAFARDTVRCVIVDDSAEKLRPDVTLVDVNRGAESGFDLAEQLHRSAEPPSPVILISTHAEADFADSIGQ
jgi:DNA-binding NarL/FixJ family response regulator